METRSLFRSRALWIAAVLGVPIACSRTEDGSDYPHAADAARRQYIAERVGLCIDCHSPRDENGEFQRERCLCGAAIPFQPTVPMPPYRMSEGDARDVVAYLRSLLPAPQPQ